MAKLEEYSDAPLTALENRKARRMLEENDRAHWLWSFLIKCVITAGALAAAAGTVKTYVAGLFK